MTYLPKQLNFKNIINLLGLGNYYQRVIKCKKVMLVFFIEIEIATYTLYILLISIGSS